MWSLLRSLVSTFLLLRDLLGYLIPGTLFTGMIAISVGKTDLQTYTLARLPALPDWAWGVVFFVLSYIAGHVLVAAGYAILGLPKRWCDRTLSPEERRKKKDAAAEKEATEEAEYICYRHLYPHIAIDLDRRRTIHVLRIGFPIALIVGPWGLPLPPGMIWAIVVVGAAMLWNADGAFAHLKTMRRTVVDGAKQAKKHGSAIFNWNGAKTDEK